jgi:hypothetical protein
LHWWQWRNGACSNWEPWNAHRKLLILTIQLLPERIWRYYQRKIPFLIPFNFIYFDGEKSTWAGDCQCEFNLEGLDQLCLSVHTKQEKLENNWEQTQMIHMILWP